MSLETWRWTRGGWSHVCCEHVSSSELGETWFDLLGGASPVNWNLPPLGIGVVSSWLRSSAGRVLSRVSKGTSCGMSPGAESNQASVGVVVSFWTAIAADDTSIIEETDDQEIASAVRYVVLERSSPTEE